MTGFYRYVRNPMYLAVLVVLLGQTLLFGHVGVLIYAIFVALYAHGFVVLYEEPTLQDTFGAEYAQYCRQVRRWLPRLTPAQL